MTGSDHMTLLQEAELIGSLNMGQIASIELCYGESTRLYFPHHHNDPVAALVTLVKRGYHINRLNAKRLF